MRFDDGLCDGETHACTLHTVALSLAAIELVEDHHSLEVVNARAAVSNTGNELSLGNFGANKNRTSFRGILCSILQ